MSSEKVKKPHQSKEQKELEELKQKYLMTKSEAGKALLLALIKRKDPKFKG